MLFVIELSHNPDKRGSEISTPLTRTEVHSEADGTRALKKQRGFDFGWSVDESLLHSKNGLLTSLNSSITHGALLSMIVGESSQVIGSIKNEHESIGASVSVGKRLITNMFRFGYSQPGPT